MSLAKRARIAYEPYGVVGVIGAGSAPFAQPLGQIAGALLAGNGVAFKPAARAGLAGERIARVLARAGLPEGLVRIVHGGADVGVALAQSPVDKILFTGSPAVGRVVARACVSREKEVTVELGGKDAMLVLADAHLPRAVAGALWAGCAGRRAGARVDRARVRRARGATSASSQRLVRGAQATARRRPRGPARAGRPAGLARAAPSTSRSSSSEARRAGRAAALRRPVEPAAAARRAPSTRPAVITGVTHEMRMMREPLDGPVLAVMAVDSRRRGDRAGQRQRLRPRRVGVDRRPLPGRCASRASCTPGWCGSTTTCPARRSRAGPWGAAAGGGLGRTLGQAGLRACAQEKLITWDPPAHARAVVGPLRRDHRRAPRARSRSCARRARPTASAPGARARAARSARGSGARARSGAACPRAAARQLRRLSGRLRLPLRHARPGLCRQGVRLPAAQGNLRPELRAGDARHARSTSPA